MLAIVALVAAGDSTGSSKPSSSSKPPLADLRKSEAERAEVTKAYQRQLENLDLEALEEIEDQPTAAIYKPPSREASVTSRPNLEPVDEDAHPPQNRRVPTQPPDVLSLAVDGITEEQLERERKAAPAAAVPAPVAEANASPTGSVLPPPPSISRASPSPAVGPSGLFSDDRVTNLLAGAAVGLLLMVFPAKKLAGSVATREVDPRLADLATSVEQPLAVEAGTVESPETIVASIDAGQSKARKRFVLIWLLGGLPIGLGLGFAPRFWD